jgi:hypothetical protein
MATSNRLRHGSLLKLAVGRSPETGELLASQSTISLLENAPCKTEPERLTAVLIDQFCVSVTPGQEEVLDIETHPSFRTAPSPNRATTAGRVHAPVLAQHPGQECDDCAMCAICAMGLMSKVVPRAQ